MDLFNLDQKYSKNIFEFKHFKALDFFISKSSFGYGMIFPFLIGLLSQNSLLKFGIILVLVVGFGFINEFLIKKIFKRERPKTSDKKSSYSFPSTHSVAVTAFLVNFIWGNSFTLTPIIILIALIYLLWILITRVYMGHHFISDVVGGLLGGVVGGILILMLMV